MLKPGKYLRSRNNGHIYPFDARDLAHPAMEVVYVGEDQKVMGDFERDAERTPVPQEDPPADEPTPEQDEDSERTELVELYVKKNGRRPHPSMRLARLRQAVQGGG